MAKHKRDYGALLNAFGDRRTKPTATRTRESIRLPSLEQLLAIESAEQAVPATRTPVQRVRAFDATSEPFSVVDASAGTDGHHERKSRNGPIGPHR